MTFNPVLSSVQTPAQAIEIAVLAEREACAKVCDDAADKTVEISVSNNLLGYKSGCVDQARWCAEKIRARGEP